MDQKLAFFKEYGYWVEHDALSAAEIDLVLGASEDAKGSAPALVEDTTAFDALAYHPSVFPLAQRVLGDGALLSGLSYGDARPNATSPPADPYAEDDTLVLNGRVVGADVLSPVMAFRNSLEAYLYSMVEQMVRQIDGDIETDLHLSQR